MESVDFYFIPNSNEFCDLSLEVRMIQTVKGASINVSGLAASGYCTSSTHEIFKLKGT
jgi:hypothetical protein